MPNLRLSIILNPHNNPIPQDGKAALYLRISYHGRAYINTGYSCKPSQWNKKTERVKGNPEANEAFAILKTMVRMYGGRGCNNKKDKHHEQ